MASVVAFEFSFRLKNAASDEGNNDMCGPQSSSYLPTMPMPTLAMPFFGGYHTIPFVPWLSLIIEQNILLKKTGIYNKASILKRFSQN